MPKSLYLVVLLQQLDRSAERMLQRCKPCRFVPPSTRRHNPHLTVDRRGGGGDDGVGVLGHGVGGGGGGDGGGAKVRRVVVERTECVIALLVDDRGLACDRVSTPTAAFRRRVLHISGAGDSADANPVVDPIVVLVVHDGVL